MDRSPIAHRAAVADTLRRSRRTVAEAVTDEFLTRHPDWVVRFGDRARTFGIEDAGYHVDFLSAAIEAGSPLGFEDYARWTARMLGARGIAPTSLAENLEQVGQALAPLVAVEERDALAALVDAGKRAALAPAVPAPAVGGALAETRSLLLQALLLGSRRTAATIVLDAMTSGVPVLDLYVSVFQEVLYEVGRLWEANRITVAQEHMATSIVEYLLTLLYDRLERSATTRGRAVITGVAGELHSVGAHLVSDVLEADGWDVRYLGTNVPNAGVVTILREHQASVLGISATLLTSIPKVHRLVDDVARELKGRAPRLIVGGSAFRVAPDLVRELGAEAAALDLTTAITAFRGAPAAT